MCRRHFYVQAGNNFFLDDFDVLNPNFAVPRLKSDV